MRDYYIKMVTATIFAVGSYWVRWWLPLIIFPFLILLLPSKSTKNLSYFGGSLLAMRWVFYVIATGYVIGQTIIFHMNVGSWYGWIIGLVIGWILSGVIAGKLEPYLKHRSF